MIGAYVHHRGFGHLHRVLAVLDALDEDATVLTSAHVDPLFLPARVRLVGLPPPGDLPPRGTGPDPDSSLATRRAVIAWIRRERPDLFWVDADPGMALAARMTSVRMVSTVAPRGWQAEAHRLECRAVHGLVAPWPPGAFEAVPPATVARPAREVTEIGGISRFEDRPRPGRSRRSAPRVVHLYSSDGGGDPRFWRAARRTFSRDGPGEWLDLGGPFGPSAPDPWPELVAADVVVISAGQTSVADAACADVPLVVVPEFRSHGEQDVTAAALGALPGVTVAHYRDGPTAVARAVRRLVDRVGDGEVGGIRQAWRVDGATHRAVDVLRAVAESA